MGSVTKAAINYLLNQSNQHPEHISAISFILEKSKSLPYSELVELLQRFIYTDAPSPLYPPLASSIKTYLYKNSDIHIEPNYYMNVIRPFISHYDPHSQEFPPFNFPDPLLNSLTVYELFEILSLTRVQKRYIEFDSYINHVLQPRLLKVIYTALPSYILNTFHNHIIFYKTTIKVQRRLKQAQQNRLKRHISIIAYSKSLSPQIAELIYLHSQKLKPS